MRPKGTLAVVVVAILALLGVTATTATAAARGEPTAGVHAASVAGGAPSGSAGASGGGIRWVTLVTGDRVAVTTGPGGRQSASVLFPRGTKDPVVMTWRRGGDLYVLPHSAAAKLGKTLTVEDFNVSRLLRSGSAAGAPKAAPRASVTPNFQLQTLEIKAINPYGRPDSGDFVQLFNVDDLSKYNPPYQMPLTFQNGVVKTTVPAGHYEAVAEFDKQDSSGNVAAADIVVLPQFTVSARSATKITMDARAATSPITASTPRPAVSTVTTVIVDRVDALGVDAPLEFAVNAGRGSVAPSVHITPTKPVTVGKLHYLAFLTLTSRPGSTSAYSYDLVYTAEGAIPKNQLHRVSAGGLATVPTDYYSEFPGRPEALIRLASVPTLSNAVTSTRLVTAPFHETDYLTADPRIVWNDVLTIFNPSSGYSEGDPFVSPYHAYKSGDHGTQQWLKEPIHPGVAVNQGTLPPPGGGIGVFASGFICGACRAGDTLDFLVFPFADNNANTNLIEVFGFDRIHQTRTYGFFKDGTQVSSGSLGFGDTLSFAVSPGPATYQLVYDAGRTDPPLLTLSPSTHTVWTFGSAHQSGGSLPAGWQCSPDSTSTACAILPLLFANYDLPTSLAGREGAGATRFTLDVAHIQDGPTSPVADPSVQVSFDGGTTWTAATVARQSGGKFTVSYTNPAAASTDGYAALRVSAHDDAGSQIDQTILRAYAIGG
ncbi:MAG: hypothetical protein ACRDP6_13080 [Actinoallomurus sp.]